jgi:hypothetical protein
LPENREIRRDVFGGHCQIWLRALSLCNGSGGRESGRPPLLSAGAGESKSTLNDDLKGKMF